MLTSYGVCAPARSAASVASSRASWCAAISAARPAASSIRPRCPGYTIRGRSSSMRAQRLEVVAERIGTRVLPDADVRGDLAAAARRRRTGGRRARRAGRCGRRRVRAGRARGAARRRARPCRPRRPGASARPRAPVSEGRPEPRRDEVVRHAEGPEVLGRLRLVASRVRRALGRCGVLGALHDLLGAGQLRRARALAPMWSAWKCVITMRRTFGCPSRSSASSHARSVPGDPRPQSISVQPSGSSTA